MYTSIMSKLNFIYCVFKMWTMVKRLIRLINDDKIYGSKNGCIHSQLFINSKDAVHLLNLLGALDALI